MMSRGLVTERKLHRLAPHDVSKSGVGKSPVTTVDITEIVTVTGNDRGGDAKPLKRRRCNEGVRKGKMAMTALNKSKGKASQPHRM